MLSDVIQILIFMIVLLILAIPLGAYMAKVLKGEASFLTPILSPIEDGIYKILNIERKEMKKKEYLINLLMFNLIGGLFLFFLLLFQGGLPLNPMKWSGVSWDLALNTTISFVTNTNWQSYSGETTLSYLSQMVGLGVQNFLSAATGLAVMTVIIKALAEKRETLGNYWVDLTRSILYILLPLTLVFSILLMSQGVIQNFLPYKEIINLEGVKQIIPSGPAASQIAIKQIGTNGGGFFGANSAHPFENPTPFSNLLQMLAILLIPVAQIFTYGKMLNARKQAFVIFGVVSVLFLGGLFLQYSFEAKSAVGQLQTFMEGKETRFGLVNSVLWSEATTSASNGSVNSMLDSFSPIAGLVGMMNIMTGEVIFGGAGAGLYGILMYVIITVFIAGLMVGRTPEYLCKKIEKKEMFMSILAVLAPSFLILLFTALALVVPSGFSVVGNGGPHGLSEIVYSFTSAAGNNGSAFAGLATNNVFYNIFLAIAMLIGRFVVIYAVLEIADSMGQKDKMFVSEGTFKTDTVLFGTFLIGIIVFIGLLTFFPVLMLGPVAEHLLHLQGISF